MNTRNLSIEKSIEDGNVPVLSFEIAIAELALRDLGDRQTELGETLGAAMEQSSETWHDNAPAEIIAADSRVLVSAASAKMEFLRKAQVFEMPDSPEETTLGSVVKIAYGPDDEETLFLAGATRELSDELHEQLDDIEEVVTLQSPMGAALLGHLVGDTIKFLAPNGRKVEMKILEIQ